MLFNSRISSLVDALYYTSIFTTSYVVYTSCKICPNNFMDIDKYLINNTFFLGLGTTFFYLGSILSLETFEQNMIEYFN